MTFKMPRATQEVDPYPLLWPQNRERTPSYKREKKRWSVNWQTAVADLKHELAAAKLHDTALSTGRTPGTGKIEDCGAALWFMQRIGQSWVMSCYPCDHFRDLPQNIKAIAMTIQRLRLIESYGCYSFEQATQGAAYRALPPPERPPRDWWEVLEISPTSPRVVVDAVFKALSKQRHPDAETGSVEAFQELNRAYEAAKEQVQ